MAPRGSKASTASDGDGDGTAAVDADARDSDAAVSTEEPSVNDAITRLWVLTSD